MKQADQTGKYIYSKRRILISFQHKLSCDSCCVFHFPSAWWRLWWQRPWDVWWRVHGMLHTAVCECLLPSACLLCLQHSLDLILKTHFTVIFSNLNSITKFKSAAKFRKFQIFLLISWTSQKISDILFISI